MRITLLAVVVMLLPSAAAPAQPLDARWDPWVGCWQLVSDSGVRVCVNRAPDTGGVTLATSIATPAASDGAPPPAFEQSLVADGTRRPVAEPDCRGWQQADWSRTGELLFANAELTCADGTRRTVTGLSMIAASDVWIDVQGIEIDGREQVRVRRYRRAADDAATVPGVVSLAPRLWATRLTVDEVKEASARLSPRVVEAALVETDASFDLTSGVLRDLDRAGVAGRVIDAMVALSYPERFVVDRAFTSAGTPPPPGGGWYGAWTYPYDGPYWSPYAPYYYSPFGYTYVYVPGGGVAPDEEAVGTGRAIDGVGYTRIRTRAEAAEEDRESGTPPQTARDAPTSGTSSAGGSSGSSGGSTSGASPSGFSNGSSGARTGRTAQPR